MSIGLPAIIHFSFLLLIILVLLLLLRALGFLKIPSRGGFLPKAARVGDRTSRIAEAIVLLCAAAAIFVFTATNTSTGGRLLILDQFRPGFAAANVVVAVVIAIGIAVGILIVLTWRTAVGVLIAAAVLCCYGVLLNGPEHLLESLAPKGSTIPDASLTFRLSSPDVDGAELWVNGVHLGTLPYETTFEDFYQKVPYWAEEPNELKNRSAMLFVPDHWNPHSSRASGSYYRLWAEITIPKEPEHWRVRKSRRIMDPNERRKIEDADERSRTFYARVKLGDEWGGFDGSGSSSGGGGRYDRRRANVHFGFIFPQRTARIEKLLDKARLSDYHPDAEWFKAMLTYRADGWVTVRKAMDDEPEMSQVLDAWAVWQYELDKVTDSKSAWRAFEHICRQADQRQYYLTSDIAGRAVELLAPKLDPNRLIHRALKIIRSTQSFGWYAWQMNGRTQFGFSYRPEGFHPGASRISGAWIGGGGGRLSPSDYAVAHAVWMLDEMLDNQDDGQSNVIEHKLVPAFICWNFRSPRLLRVAAKIGGPDIERYLLRQRWRTKPEDLPYLEQVSIHGRELNGWLYLLANLRGPAGRRFRREKESRLFEMADVLVNDMRMRWNDELAFLFDDIDRGSESLAVKYWPRFRRLTNKKKHDALSLQYHYLLRMEPATTVDMYVQCWKDYRADWSYFHEALDVFDKLVLRLDKREQIVTALIRLVEQDMSNVTHDSDPQRERRNLLMRLKGKLLPLQGIQLRLAENIIAQLKANSSEYKAENVAAWLENEPTHPLITMLVDSNEPELRLLVMGALKEHPNPANRAILQRLLGDSDERVRKAAEEVAAELKALAEMPPKKLVAVSGARPAES